MLVPRPGSSAPIGGPRRCGRTSNSRSACLNPCNTSKRQSLKFVNDQRMRICPLSSYSSCDADFQEPTRLAKWLDAQEEVAAILKRSGDDEDARQLRREILIHSILLDIILDQLLVYHGNE